MGFFLLTLTNFTNHGYRGTSEQLKGEGKGDSSNQQKVRGLNNVSKVIGLVKDKDLAPNFSEFSTLQLKAKPFIGRLIL
jgi:hypothetical protein